MKQYLSVEDAIAIFIPFGFSWLCFIVLFIEHTIDIYNIRFQALCLRIAFAFPVLSTLNLIALFTPYLAGVWIEILFPIAEMMILLQFTALIVGWIWHRGGNVYEILLQYPAGQSPCFFKCFACGPKFKSGERALTYQVFTVGQYGLVKFLTTCVNSAVLTAYGADQETRLLHICLVILNTVSLVLALKALFILYRVLGKATDKKTGDPLFRGLAVTAKFLVIKLLCSVIVLNGFVLAFVQNAGQLKPPNVICDMTDTDEECALQMQAFVFLVECALLSVFVLLFYRSQAICYPEFFGNFEHYRGDEPIQKRTTCKLLFKMFQLWDLKTYFYPLKDEDYKQSDVESLGRSDNTDKQSISIPDSIDGQVFLT